MLLGEKTKAIEISQLIKRGELTVKEVVDFFLKRIKEIDTKVNAFITILDEEKIYDQVKIVQEKINLGESYSRLAGIPIAIKDNIVTKGIKTTCASKILYNFIPPYDATVITRIKQAGLIIVGKTNLDEFAMGSSTENSAFFPTKNPWDISRVPGGSSGGSATAVASWQVPLALGSDTGGSIRQPASFCGIVGLCPTYGRVSRFGLVAFASSLDRIGPMTIFTEDCAELLNIIAGYDPKDSTCSPAPKEDYLAYVTEMFSKLSYGDKNLPKKIGIPREFFTDDVDKRIKELILKKVNELSKSFPFDVQEVSLPTAKYSIPIYYIIAPAEASSNLSRYDGVKYGFSDFHSSIWDLYTKTRGHGFGDEVKRRIFIGTFVLSSGYYDAYYLKAQKAITLLKREFDQVFKKVDFIVCPVAPELPFRLGEKAGDPIKMYLSDILTVPSSLAGLPAISVPIGFISDDGKELPVGIQIIGKPFCEGDILTLAKCFEEISNCASKTPKL